MKMTNPFPTLIFGVALLCGCAQEQPDLIKAPKGPVDDPLPQGAYPQIVLLDGLARRIVGSSVRELPADSDNNKMMRVRVTLRSVVDRELPVQYRFVFLDEDGETVDDPYWQSLTFAPRTERELVGTAPNYQAAKGKMEVRDFR